MTETVRDLASYAGAMATVTLHDGEGNTLTDFVLTADEVRAVLSALSNRDVDWWVDGHFVSAHSRDAALSAASTLFSYDAQVARPWTEADQTEGGVA